MLISIVTPVLNEEKILDKFYTRVLSTFQAIATDFEILFIDDGSTDQSWKKIQELHLKDSRVRGIRFSRNFGYQPAMSAGLDHACGDAIVIIDSDLQDPPELIPQLMGKWQEGYDIVYAVRKKREGETIFKKATAAGFYRTIRSMSQMDIPLDTGDYRLVSRKVVDALQSLPEKVRFIRGLTTWIGFSQVGVLYEREKRSAGETKFKLAKMVKFAFDGITSFSTLPLTIATYLGLITTAVAFLVLIYAVSVRFFNVDTVPGWTSVIVSVLFVGGVQLITLGILGEYIGRIYQEVKNRPLYLAKEKLGIIESSKK